MRAVIVYIEGGEDPKKAMESLSKFPVEIDLIKVKNPSDKTDPLDELNKYFESGVKDDIIVWHPDMFATPNWYDSLMKYYDSFDVIGNKLIYPNNIIQHFGGAISSKGVGYHPHQGALDIGLNTPSSCAYVTGPGTIIKKYVAEKLGNPLFDKQFFKGYYGDVDFCFRAREKGFSVGVVPSKIIHIEGADSIRRRSSQKTLELQKKHHEIFVSKWMHYLSNFK